MPIALARFDRRQERPSRARPLAVPPLPHPSWERAFVEAERLSPVSATEFWKRLGL